MSQAIWKFAVSLGMCDTQNGVEQLSAHFSKCCTAASMENCSNSGVANNSVVKEAGRLPLRDDASSETSGLDLDHIKVGGRELQSLHGELEALDSSSVPNTESLFDKQVMSVPCAPLLLLASGACGTC